MSSRLMKRLLFFPLIMLVLLSCNDNPVEEDTGTHTMKLKNNFDFNGINFETSLSLTLDGSTVISSVSYGQTKSYSGIKSGKHVYDIIYTGDGFANWEEASIDFIGQDRTFTVTVTSSGECMGYWSF